MLASLLTTLELKIWPEIRDNKKYSDFLKKKVELIDRGGFNSFYFQFNLCATFVPFLRACHILWEKGCLDFFLSTTRNSASNGKVFGGLIDWSVFGFGKLGLVVSSNSKIKFIVMNYLVLILHEWAGMEWDI